MSGVECSISKDERTLIQCRNGGWSLYDADYCGGHNHDAGVKCDNEEGKKP